MSKKSKIVSTSDGLYRRLSPLVFICLLAITLLMVMNFGLSFSRKALPPENVKIANISDNSLSVSWTTSQPSYGSLILSTQKSRVARVWEFFVCKSFGLKCHIIYDEIASPSTTHYVFLRNLLPETAYYYRLASDGDLWKYDKEGMLLPSLKTAGTLSSLPMPQPIYSYVYEADGQTPVKGALIYFYLFEGTNRQQIKSQPLMTYTDSRGVWMLDLGNLRSQDTKNWVNVSYGDLAMFFIEAPGGRRTGSFVEMKKSVNLEPIILK